MDNIRLPCTSLEEAARGANGWLSSFSISVDDLLDLLLFTKKNATIPPTTNREINIPAMPPPPIPDFLLPPSLSEGLLLLSDLCFGLFFLAGGVPGGGGGAGPELQLLPSFLQWRWFRSSEFNLSEDTSTILFYNTIQCLLQINVFQLFRNPAGKTIIRNVPKKNKHK